MLTPEDIAARTFLVSLRGFDREEVKSFLAEVADGLAAVQQRVAELEEEVAAQTAAAAEAAEAAAAARAEAEAAKAAASASAADDPNGVRSEVFAEVAKETQRILEAAQIAGEELQRNARADSERMIKAAKTEANRIIAEGELRREAMEREIAAMEERREEIARALRDVGRSIERALRELLDLPEPAGTMREALAEAMRAEALVAAPVSPAVVEEPVADEPTDVPGQAVADAEPSEEKAPELPEEPAAEDVGAVEEPAAEEPEVALVEEPTAEELEAEEALPVEEPADEKPATAEPAVAEPATEAEPLAEAEPPASAEAAADVEPFDEAEPFAEAEPVNAESVAPEVESLATEEPAEADVQDAAPDDEPDEDPDVIAEAHSLRARALAPLHPKLVRKLKRSLQDLQNELLDRLRRANGRGALDRFLPDADAIADLAYPLEPFLAAAWEAGVASGLSLADAPGEAADSAGPAAELAHDIAGALGLRLGADLEKTLSVGLAAGEDVAALADRVGLVFSELKEEPVEEQSALALLRIYEDGLLSAWQSGGVEARRWVPVSEHGCGDPRCHDNHRAGPVPLGQPFPSGHIAPPVRNGCNCTTVPHISESELAS